MKTRISLILLLMLSMGGNAQPRLILHTEAVDSMMVWFGRGNPHYSVENLCTLPAHQLAGEALLSNIPDAMSLRAALLSFNPRDTIAGAQYVLPLAYKQRDSIAAFMKAINSRGFSTEVYNRIGSYFPAGYTSPRSYEVYFTTVGWEWGDAMCISYTINNGKYSMAESGTPTVLFNVTNVCITYGNTLRERLTTFSNVLSHELFHAQLEDFRKTHWQDIEGDSITYEALLIILNEGVAHFVADGEFIGKQYPSREFIRNNEIMAFAFMASKAAIFFDKNRPHEERLTAIKEGTYGKYWSKYMCITGLFMAYHIEQLEGREALQDCVKQGPVSFVRRYMALTEHNASLPKLPGLFAEI
ncbi:DUF5700 domain-containing putative Zn-dependent protease [Williamwhitmania taraxaci]|uniref:Peptidase MA superfamily protein n=1 Tax=Williamwhitmania taraxaci TaxID=1640674 RepID=A0A1G6GW09_9BACT|nr:DUF5700 domain-containing putative Zn-dependent protease [Williamwhitmania taraxaci]SDB86144.1 hypothetical protein SAMN05216323_100486 [Williamwhitmania taraxaci]